MKNELHVGEFDVVLPKGGYIFITDVVPDIKRVKVFDPREHSINIFNGLDYRTAGYFVEILDVTSRGGPSTLTREEGLDYIFDRLEDCYGEGDGDLAELIPLPSKSASNGHQWAHRRIKRLLRSPVMRSVLCRPKNDFAFREGAKIIMRIDRRELRREDAMVLGLLGMSRAKGQVVVKDMDRYACEMLEDFMAEGRLIAHVRTLQNVDLRIRENLLLTKDKFGKKTNFKDAKLLAENSGLRPDPLIKDNEYNRRIDTYMAA